MHFCAEQIIPTEKWTRSQEQITEDESDSKQINKPRWENMMQLSPPGIRVSVAKAFKNMSTEAANPCSAWNKAWLGIHQGWSHHPPTPSQSFPLQGIMLVAAQRNWKVFNDEARRCRGLLLLLIILVLMLWKNKEQCQLSRSPIIEIWKHTQTFVYTHFSRDQRERESYPCIHEKYFCPHWCLHLMH